MAHINRAFIVELNELRLIDLNLIDEDAILICEFLILHPNLDTLDIKNNLISIKGTSAIIQTLIKHKIHLRKLILSGNMIGPYNAVELGEYIRQNINLIRLDVQFTSLGSIGAEMLACYMKDHPSLQFFDVTHNRIKDHGAISLLICLKTCPKLNFDKDIDIVQGNQLTQVYEAAKKALSADDSCASRVADLKLQTDEWGLPLAESELHQHGPVVFRSRM